MAGLLGILLLFFGISAKAQSVLPTPFQIQILERNELTACGSPSTLKVRLNLGQAYAAESTTVTIDLADGVEYVPNSLKIEENSVISLVEDGGTANQPQFKITPEPRSFEGTDYVVFTIQRRALCGAVTDSKDKVIVESASYSPVSAESTGYQVYRPELAFVQPATINNAVTNKVYERTFEIRNGGIGAATLIRIKVQNESGVFTQSIKLTGGSGSAGTPVEITPDSNGYYIVDASYLSDGTLDNNENLVFTESVKATACNNTGTTYDVSWGCGDDACQSISGSSDITISTGAASLAIENSKKLDYTDQCTPFTTRFVYKNTGTDPGAGMYNVKIRWGNFFSGDELNNGAVDRSWLNFLSGKIGNADNLAITNGSPSAYSFSDVTFLDLEDKLTYDPDGPGVGLEDLDGDGFYDDLPPGATITVDVLMKINCQSKTNCKEYSISNSWDQWTDIRYSTMCSPTTFITTKPQKHGLAISREINGITNKSYSAANIVGGQPFKARFAINISQYYLDQYDTDKTRYRYVVTLPEGYSLVGGKNGVTYKAGFYPNASNAGFDFEQSGNVITITGQSKWMGWIELDLMYTCSGGEQVKDIPFEFRRIDNISSNCNTCNEEVLLCDKLSISQILCPNKPCDAGVTLQEVKVERAENSLGWTDYTMQTRMKKSDFTNSTTDSYELARALPLDEFEVLAKATYRSSAVNDQYFYFGLRKVINQNKDLVTPKSIKLQKLDANGNVTAESVMNYSAANVSNAGSNNELQVIRWNISSLLSQLNLQDGDTFRAVSTYQVRKEAEFPKHDVITGERAYFYQLNNDAEQYCLAFVPEVYLAQLGYVDGSNNGFNGKGCEEMSIGSRTHYYGYRFDNAGNKFIKEYRPGIKPKALHFTIPKGFDISKVEFEWYAAGLTTDLIKETKLVSTNQDGSKNYRTTFPSDANFEITVTNTYAGSVDVRIKAKCDAPTTQSVYKGTLEYIEDYYHHFTNDAPTKQTEVTRTFTYNANTKPQLQIINLSGEHQASRPKESVRFEVKASSDIAVPNVWVALPNHTKLQEVKIIDEATGQEVQMTDYKGGRWFTIGDMPGNTSKTYRIDLAYKECKSKIDFNVNAGWNCTGFPTDPAKPNCTPMTAKMTIVPQPGELQVSGVSQPATKVDLCQTLEYQFNVISAGAGNINGNQFSIILPKGMAFVENTVQVEYPLGSGNWQTVTSTSQTSNAGVTTLKMDLTAHNNYPADGLPGTLNDGGNSNNRIMAVKFNVVSNCDFKSGSVITINADAKQNCGNPLRTLKLSSNRITINKAEPSYSVSISASLATALNDLKDCDKPVFVNVRQTFSNVSAQDDPSSSVTKVYLPEGYTGIELICDGGMCPQFGGNILTDPDTGRKYAELTMPQGIVSGTALDYQVKLIPGPNITGGDFTIDFESEALVKGLTCGTEICKSIRSVIFVAKTQFKLEKCVCYNPVSNKGAGTPVYHGITTLNRAGAQNGNWPMVRNSAHTVLESNTKGFVITRMATTELSSITNPEEGMMVYDTTEKCLKIYADGAWKCFNRPACP